MAVHLLPIKAFPFWKYEASVFLSPIRKQGQCYLLVQPEYMQGHNTINMMWSFKNWIKFSSYSSTALVEAEHQNEKSIQIGPGNMISPQSLHWNFMFLYRGFMFYAEYLQELHNSSRRANAVICVLQTHGTCLAVSCWRNILRCIGEKKREKHIWNLKRVHFHFFFAFQNVFPFFPLTSQATSSVKWPYKFIYFICNH